MSDRINEEIVVPVNDNKKTSHPGDKPANENFPEHNERVDEWLYWSEQVDGDFN